MQQPLSTADVIAKLVPALEAEARFSAAFAQGRPSLCPDSAGETVLGVWSVESGTDPFTKRPGVRLHCFALVRPLYTPLESMRDAQDAGALTQITHEWFAPEKGATIAFQLAPPLYQKRAMSLRTESGAAPRTSALPTCFTSL